MIRLKNWVEVVQTRSLTWTWRPNGKGRRFATADLALADAVAWATATYRHDEIDVADVPIHPYSDPVPLEELGIYVAGNCGRRVIRSGKTLS